MFQKRSLVLLLAALVVAGACSDEKEPRPSGAGGNGGGGGSGGTGGSAGEGPRPAGPELGARDALGAFLPAQPKALLLGVEKPLLVVGTQGIAYDPTQFGRPALGNGEPGAPTNAISVGLLTVDTSTGGARVLTHEDGLPTIHYADVFQDFGESTASIIDLDWITPDQTFVGAAWNHLLKGTLAADGTWSFAHVQLRAPGATQDSLVFHVESVGETIYAGGDQGLALVSAENLQVQSWVDFGAANTTIHDISAGTLAGEQVAAVLYGGPDAGAPSGIGLVHEDGTFQPIELPQGLVPTTALVLDTRVLFGVQRPDDVGAIYAWEQNDGVWSLSEETGPVMLVTDGNRYPVVPNVLFYDQFRAELVIGGRIVKGAPGGPGGGVVTVRYTPDYGIGSRADDLLVKQDPAFADLPWQVDAIGQDSDGNLYVAGRQLCNEHRMLQLPVLRVERSGGEARLVRPWIDGVRSIAVDPKNGETWLGLRGEIPGVACDGLAVSQSLCRLRADGACVITTPKVNANADWFAPTPGAVEVAFGDPAKNQVAIATLRDATFAQYGDQTRALATQIQPGLNLRSTSAAWSTEDTLWIGSIMEWDDFYEDEAVNHRGPHGLGWIHFDRGFPKQSKRYVRVESDSQPDVDVGGLPSNMVWDVLPLEGATRAVVAMGVERGPQNYDHIFGAELEHTDSRGGVAIVDGETITVIAAPEGSDMDEVVALARADGVIYALDANEGIFTIDAEKNTAARWTSATWEGTERALSIAVDPSGHVAVGTTHGLHVFGADKGVTKAIEGLSAGWVWSVSFVEDGVLYAGTDEGLQRIAIGAAELPAKGPESLARWPFPLPPNECNGQPGCLCSVDAQCTTGSSCVLADWGDGGLESKCTPIDLCASQPGDLDCACAPETSGSCAPQFVCTTSDEGVSSCQLPPEEECGGVDGCRCGVDRPCAEGYECNFNFHVCLPADPGGDCRAGCNCTGPDTTEDGCPIGESCHSMGFGSECLPDDGPTGCEADCSCTGEGTTTDGCFEGQSCLPLLGGGHSCG